MTDLQYHDNLAGGVDSEDEIVTLNPLNKVAGLELSLRRADPDSRKIFRVIVEYHQCAL